MGTIGCKDEVLLCKSIVLSIFSPMRRDRRWPGLRRPPTLVNVSNVVHAQGCVQHQSAVPTERPGCISIICEESSNLHRYLRHVHTAYPGSTTRDSHHAIWQRCNRQGEVITITVTRKPCPNRVFIQRRHILPRNVTRRETCRTHCHGTCGTSVILTGSR